jgi:hypothetical protein
MFPIEIMKDLYLVEFLKISENIFNVDDNDENFLKKEKIFVKNLQKIFN